jgi:hypothetical protein
VEHRADLVALALLQGVALRAAGLEEVGTLLSIACRELLANMSDEMKSSPPHLPSDRKACAVRITSGEMLKARLSSYQCILATWC